MAARPHHATVRPCISGSAAVASRPRLAALVAGSRHSSSFLLISLHFKRLCLTPACTTPVEMQLVDVVTAADDCVCEHLGVVEAAGA